MKILITGGCGFIGSNLTDKLIEHGHDVVVLDNLSTGKISHLNKNAKFIGSDIRNQEFIKLLEKDKFETIYHIAALPRIKPSFENPREVIDVNTTGTLNLLELARKSNCKFIYAGSSSAYFDIFANPYSYSKYQGEQHCILYNKVFNVSVAIARFFNVYGPRHVTEGENANVLGIFETQTKNGVPLTVTGDGSKRRDFTHVDDICDGLIEMSAQRWNADYFDLGRQNNYSILEVAKMFNPRNIEFIPARKGEADVTLANIQKSKDLLGFNPKRNLPDYIDSFLKSLVKNEKN
jgi:UDP-glucose 4-epimerase